MSKLMRWPILSLSLTLFLSCAPDPYENPDATRAFFGKHKIGTSPDYGIVKFGNIEDHVITVHGFADDFASC